MEIEIKDLNRKLKEEEKNKETIRNENLVTTNKLKELMKEKKDVKKLEEENEELYNLLDILAKNFKDNKERSNDHFGFNKDGIHKDTKMNIILMFLI